MRNARRSHLSYALLLAAATFALISMACSGDSEPTPASTPTATLPMPQGSPPPFVTPPAGPTPAATPGAPQASIPFTTTPVRWMQVQNVPLNPLIEEQAPFPEIRRNVSTPPVWNVYVVGEDGMSRPVLNTPRWVDGVEWESNGVVLARFLTERRLVVPSSGSSPLSWRGSFRIDVAANRTTESYELFPTDLPLAIDKPISVQRQPGGKSLLVTFSNGTPTTQPQSYEFKDVLLVDESGRARRLEGITGLRSLSWVPNGKFLVGHRGSGSPSPVFAADFIPVTDGQAVSLSRVSAMMIEGGNVGQPDAQGHRVAVLVGDGPLRTLVGVFDADTGKLNTVGTSTVAPQEGVLWPAGKDTILLGNVELFDVTTGRARPGGYADLFPTVIDNSSTSPDGRFVARFDEPQKYQVTPECAGLPFRLVVEDKRGGATRAPLECHSGTSGYLTWLNSTKLLAGISACWSCGSDEHNIILVDAASGAVRQLTTGLETSAAVAPSPRGDRIAVTGKGLRVFSAEGVLQRDYGAAPAGYTYDAVAWSPDGTKFAYVVRPTGWRLGP